MEQEQLVGHCQKFTSLTRMVNLQREMISLQRQNIANLHEQVATLQLALSECKMDMDRLHAGLAKHFQLNLENCHD